MTPRKIALTLASVVAVCALFSFAASGNLGRSRGEAAASLSGRKVSPGYGSYLQVAGVQPREFDAVDRGLRRDGDAWVRGDVDLEAVRDALDEPENLDALAAEDPRWQVTQTWKMLHGGASSFAQAKEHCSARHLLLLERPCVIDIDVVVERRGPVGGEVVAARPRTAPDATDECRAFADCSAKYAWLGRPAPLPEIADSYHGFKAGDARMPQYGTKSDQQAGMRTQMEELRGNIATMRRFEDADPSVRQNIELQQDLLEHLEWLESQ